MQRQNDTTIRNNNRAEYNKKYYTKKAGFTLRRGIHSVKHSVIRRIALGFGLLIAIAIWLFQDRWFSEALLSDNIQNILVALIAVGVVIITVLLLGNSLTCTDTEHSFDRIGLTNALGEPPILYGYENLKREQSPREVFIYYANGVPLEKWMDATGALEMELTRDISSIEYYKANKKLISITTAPKGATLSSFQVMDDSMIPKTDFELLLGEGLTETVSVNLNDTPHVFVGGSTGSGKTVLLKTLASQCIAKNAIVVIGDFKGGFDFREFNDSARVIVEKDEFNRYLGGLVDLMEDRKEILRKSGCANIAEYNKRTNGKTTRFIVFCDELAQITDKTGLQKSDKELVDSIIANLSTIARLGRAFGIHLILGTQRGDANILPGQIKNNIDYRICGYAPDSVLAEITLDNVAAVDVLKTNMTKKIPGRFVDNMGTIFQGYYSDRS